MWYELSKYLLNEEINEIALVVPTVYPDFILITIDGKMNIICAAPSGATSEKKQIGKQMG